MEANYFTILWWVLPYIDMNQPWVHVSPTSWTPSCLPSHPIPSLWVVPEHQLWVPCFMHWTCTGHLSLEGTDHTDRDCSWRIWVRTVPVTVDEKVLSTQIVLAICLWTPSVFNGAALRSWGLGVRGDCKTRSLLWKSWRQLTTTAAYGTFQGLQLSAVRGQSRGVRRPLWGSWLLAGLRWMLRIFVNK